MTDYKFEAGKTYNLRGGGTAEILKTDVTLHNGHSIVGIVTNKHGIKVFCSWSVFGERGLLGHSVHDLDLLPPEPERVSRWVNVYSHGISADLDSREIAESYACDTRTHVLELIYEDGVFVDVIKHKVGE